MEVKLATGIRVLSAGEVNACVEFVPGCAHNVTLCVVPELAHPVVLGVPWLKVNNPNIDW